MQTFFLFGKYSADSLKEVSAKRTKKATDIIESCGGVVKSMHALLGHSDLVIIADLPGVEEAMLVSVGLTRNTGINFETIPALAIDRFDKKASK